LTTVAASEVAAVPTVDAHVAPGTVVHADEASAGPTQHEMVPGAAMRHFISRIWAGYWQR
jgi:hypothetical protein